MKKRFVMACSLCAAFVLTAWITRANAPADKEKEDPMIITQQTAEEYRIREHAAVFQTMHFVRCGHPVERRIQVPGQLAGKGFDAVRDYYDLWEIKSMTEETVAMERYIDLFCPLHKVVYLDRTGQVVLAENRYGDGMAILKIYDATFPDEETKNLLLAGQGFDSEEMAEIWLREKQVLN